MTDAENIERWTSRKANLVSEAEALLDKQAGDDGLTDEEDARYLAIEEELTNLQSMLKHVAAADEPATGTEKSPGNIWDAIVSSAAR